MRNLFVLGAALATLFSVSNADAGVPVCAGSATGNYTTSVNEIAAWTKNTPLKLDIMTTAGSLDNANKLEQGDCVIGPIQSDVFDNYQMENPASQAELTTITPLYTEVTHLLCPVEADIESIDDLPGKASVIVGPEGSGGAETWRSWAKADKNLAKVPRLPNPVGAASLLKVKGTKTSDGKFICMLWVSGLNSADMVSANTTSINTENGSPALRLVNIDSSVLKGIKNSRGESMYKTVRVERVEPSKSSRGLYFNLIPSGWTSDSVDVLSVDALLVGRTDWVSDPNNDSLMNILAKATENALPNIWTTVSAQK